MTGTCDHCGRTYYNASGCECITVGTTPLNTAEAEVNAMKGALNDPGARPNDPSPSPNCDVCGAPMPPGAHEDPGSGILLCPDSCAPGEPDAELLAMANRALGEQNDELRRTIRDLAIAMVMDPSASPAEVLRKARLVMADRMQMQAGQKPPKT